MTDYFSVVTSNLEAFYLSACDKTIVAFENGDTESLIKSIEDLIEGYGKNKEGTWQKFFDERDEQFEGLSVKDSQDWVEVKYEKPREEPKPVL